MLKTDLTPTADEVVLTFVQPADTPPMSVVGTFNAWDPLAHPLRRRSNGTRSAKVVVPAGGELRFRYLVDGGVWSADDAVDVDESGDNVIVL